MWKNLFAPVKSYLNTLSRDEIKNIAFIFSFLFTLFAFCLVIFKVEMWPIFFTLFGLVMLGFYSYTGILYLIRGKE